MGMNTGDYGILGATEFVHCDISPWKAIIVWFQAWEMSLERLWSQIRAKKVIFPLTFN